MSDDDKRREDAARRAAARFFGNSDDSEVDEGCRVILLDEEGETEGDAWVQVWMYVRKDDIDKHL